MYGQTTNIGIARQESWGAANVSSLFWIPFISESIGVDIPPLISQALTGVYDEGEHYAGPKMVTGDLNVEAQPIALGALLTAFFGQPVSSTKADSADVYTHTFRGLQSDFDINCAKVPVTVIKNLDVGSAMQFSDLNANTLEISIANGEFLNMTLGFVGGHFQQRAAINPSFPTGKRWTWDQSSINLSPEGSGDLVNNLVNLSFIQTENIEAQHTLVNSSWPNRIKRTGFRTTEVNGTLKFESQEEYQQFLSQAEKTLRLRVTGNVAISSGYYDQFQVNIPLFRHTEFKPVAGGPGNIEVAFTGKGVYSTSGGNALNISLVNTQVSY